MSKRKKTTVPAPDQSSAQTPAEMVALSTPSAKRRVETRHPDNTPIFYANNANFEASNFDIKIRFGLIESGTPEVLRTVDVAEIYMSHEHARAFLAALASAMEQFDNFRRATVHGAKQVQ